MKKKLHDTPQPGPSGKKVCGHARKKATRIGPAFVPCRVSEGSKNARKNGAPTTVWTRR